MDVFNLQDMTSEFTVMDVTLVLVLSFALSAFIGWIYQITHRGSSYTQSFVFTLVMNGMIVALVMLIVGSNLARAFSLVGALSIIRFRNAVKETRDVGFIFFTMAIGMAIGTRFYLLGIVGALVISLVVVLMTRLDWFAREMNTHIVRVHVPGDAPFETILDRIFARYTTRSELLGVETVHNGTLTELVYSISLKRSAQLQDLVSEIRSHREVERVAVFAGYNGTDL
ncbi:MAG: DUF4956 domain-containing protein [Anaerolineae bacterium]